MSFYNRMSVQTLLFPQTCDLEWKSRSFIVESTVEFNRAWHTKCKTNRHRRVWTQTIVKSISDKLTKVLSLEYYSCEINLASASTDQGVVAEHYISSKSKDKFVRKCAQFWFLIQPWLWIKVQVIKLVTTCRLQWSLPLYLGEWNWSLTIWTHANNSQHCSNFHPNRMRLMWDNWNRTHWFLALL